MTLSSKSKRTLYEVGERLLELFKGGDATPEEVDSLLTEREGLMRAGGAEVFAEQARALRAQDQELIERAQGYFQRLRTLISLRHKPAEGAKPAARFLDFRA